MDTNSFEIAKHTSWEMLVSAKAGHNRESHENDCFRGSIQDCFEIHGGHACSSNCLIINPNYSEMKDIIREKKLPFLSVTALLGWQRLTVRSRRTLRKAVMYRTPCQKSLYNFTELHRYLLTTGSHLPINFFSFKEDVNIRNIFVSDSRVLIKDITNGQELLPISIVNAYDRKTDELAEKYISDFTYDLNVKKNHDSNFLVCCDCPNDCKNCDPQTKARYDVSEIGYSNKLLHNSLLSGIFECNRMCKCRQSCMNRVVQHETMFQLQIFKTFNKGWGVRTLHDIPEGSFVCNYVGNIKTVQKASKVNVNEDGWKYMADLHVAQPYKDGYEHEVVEPEPPKKGSLKTPESPDSGILSSPGSESSGIEMSIPEAKNDTPIPTTKSSKLSACQIVGVPIKGRSSWAQYKYYDTSLHNNQEIVSETEVTKWMSTELDSPMICQGNSTKITDTPKRCIECMKGCTTNENISDQCFDDLNNFSSTLKRSSMEWIYSASVASKGTNGISFKGVPLKNHEVLKSAAGKYSLRLRPKKAQIKRKKMNVRRRNSSVMKVGKFIADAKIEGNVGRYINHSCDPNIFPQLVFTESQDLNFPQLALFSIKDIKAGEEITWDYNYKIEDERTSPKMPCYCGSTNCRGRLF